MLHRGTNKVAVGCAAETRCLRDWAIDIIIIDGLFYSRMVVSAVSAQYQSNHRNTVQEGVGWYENPDRTY